MSLPQLASLPLPATAYHLGPRAARAPIHWSIRAWRSSSASAQLFWRAGARAAVIHAVSGRALHEAWPSFADHGEHGAEIAPRGGEHEAVPDGVLEFQPVPDVEDDAAGVEEAADHDEPERWRRQPLDDALHCKQAAPAEREAKADRQPV